MTASILLRAVTYQSKERTAVTGDYDFGPRRYISAAPFWRAPDPKAHDYPNISPYAFCAANPIRYADPTGCKIEGVRKEDAANAVQDLRDMFVGDEFAAFRELIVQSGKKQNGKSLAPISQEALAKALDGANLNADQQALVEMTVNTINSADVHIVEYQSAENVLSSSGKEAFLPGYMSNPEVAPFMAQILDVNGGLPMFLLMGDGGAGATVSTKKGTHSVIHDKAQTRPAILGHEIIGHGRSLSLGRLSTQHEDAVRTENLIYRVMGINKTLNGSNHATGTIIRNPQIIPSFR